MCPSTRTGYGEACADTSLTSFRLPPVASCGVALSASVESLILAAAEYAPGG